MIRVREYLGEQLLTEVWHDEGNSEDMEWFYYNRDSCQSNWHPDRRQEVTYFQFIREETVRPQQPVSREEMESMV